MKRLTIPRTLRQVVEEAVRVTRQPALLLWTLYIFLFPVYIFPSGLPQPGDLLVFAMMPVVLAVWNGRLLKSAKGAMRALAIFLGYVVTVNLAWSAALNAWTIDLKRGFFMSPIFYIYNALLFVFVIILYQRYGARFLWLTVRLTLASVFVQVAISFVYRGGEERTTLLFNSPNQLGYFALLSACIIVIGQRRLGVSSLLATAGLLGCAYLSFLSSSKAAIGSLGLLVIAGVFNRPRTILIAIAVFAVAMVAVAPMMDAVRRAQERIATDESAGFFEERGYDRIINHPEYWLLGSGEGAYKRFQDTTVIGDHELHSSMGTLFFCYGIVGTLAFAAYLWRSLRGVGLRQILVFLPAFAYGMTHQGLRFTLLWVLLAMLVALRDLESQQRAARRMARAQQQPAAAARPAFVPNGIAPVASGKP